MNDTTTAAVSSTSQTPCSASTGQDFSHLPWWRKDRLGWPIEQVKGRRAFNVLRIICQNIRKVTG